MEKNLILAGVGGQGILSIAYVLDNASLDAGYELKQAEVHGMSQRGGAVQSNLRYADHPILSDLIPAGRVDLIISVEPLEARRYWHTLAPNGWVVSSVTPFVNIPDYPEMDELLETLTSFPNHVLVDSAAIARAAGSLRAQNIAVLGAASPLLDFTEDQLLRYVRALFARKGEKVVEINVRAFRMGRSCGLFDRRLVEAGVPPRTALDLSRKMDPRTVNPEHAETWATLALEDPAALLEVLAADDRVSCDRIVNSRP